MTDSDGDGRVRRRTGRGPRVVRDATARRQLRNPFGGGRSLSDDEVAHIHETALAYLQRSGLRVLLPEARQRFATAGAIVDDGAEMVRFDVDHLRSLLSQAPAEFTITARNPQRSVTLGGPHLMLLPVAGPPYASDRVHGRRPGSLADSDNFVRLTQRTEVLHGTAPCVEAQDVPMQFRHLRTTASALTLSDKVPYFYARGRGVVADSLEMIRLANGVSDDEFRARPHCWTNINTNSPRQLDVPMCMGIIDSAAAGQVTIMTPFTLAGAMAPITLAGALAQQNAEALAGIAFTQVVKPGAPVAYGGFTSNVDMKSGAPAFGTPEYMKAAVIGGQLARRYRIPYRSSNTCAANAVDAQAAWESVFSLWGAIMGGANFLLHSAGWMEGGLTASYEKTIVDVDLLQMVAEFLEPVVVDRDTLALDAIRDVGPGGHYFGTPHTQARFQTAFYAPILSDWRNYESWQEAGSPTAAEKANRTWKDTLARYQPPAMDVAIREELDAFVQRRISEGGVKTDF